MMHFRFKRQVVFTAFIVTLASLPLFASIGGAAPDYDYDSILIKEFPLDRYPYQQLSIPSPGQQFRITQKYLHGHYLRTDLIGQDSLFTLSFGSIYHCNLYQARASMGYKEKHTLNFNHYSFPHRNNLNISNLGLNSSLGPWASNRFGNFLWDNHISYYIDRNEEGVTDLTSFSIRSKLSLMRESNLIDISTHIPHYHDTDYYTVAANYFHEFSIAGGRNNYLLTGIGLSSTSISGDGGYLVFPSIKLRFNYSHNLLLNMRVDKELLSYPLSGYFSDRRLFWRAKSPDNEEHLKPIVVDNYNFGVEYYLLSTKNVIGLQYREYDTYYGYEWDKDCFTVSGFEEERRTAQIKYFLGYKSSFFSLDAHLSDRIDFEPLISAAGGFEIGLGTLNSLSFKAAYNYRETILGGSEVNSYSRFTLAHKYSTLKMFSWETGVYYSTFKSDSVEWEDRPTVYVTLTYGK